MATRRLERLFVGRASAAGITLFTVPAGEKWTLREVLFTNVDGVPGNLSVRYFAAVDSQARYVRYGTFAANLGDRWVFNTVCEAGDLMTAYASGGVGSVPRFDMVVCGIVLTA